MSYSTISNFGSNVPSAIDNPLSYALTSGLNNGFLHGGSADELVHNTKPAQEFMSSYCNQGWDKICEAASKANGISKPNNLLSCGQCGSGNVPDITDGEVLIRNTASKRYLVEMLGAHLIWQPYDPTVANSPLISSWESDEQCPCPSGFNNGTPIYAVDPETIENDIVMHKLLNKPHIAFDILVNIYNTMKRKGTLQKLLGTRLGSLYQTHNYFVAQGGL